MFGTRQDPQPVRGRSVLALSALALIAFCLLPVGAQAASAGYQYSDAPPTATGSPPSESNIQGGSSTSGVGKGNGSTTGNGTKNGGKGSGSKSDNAKASKGNGDGATKTGQGSLAPGEQAGGSAAPGTDSGGSSPLVPILIAIVLLAAGSVGFVMYRRRHAAEDADGAGKPQAPGSSPKPPGPSSAAGPSASSEAS